MAKVGRPTKYNPAYNLQVEKFCKLGATDEEIADFYGVAESTIKLWRQKEPEFSASIKRGKDIADAEVAEKLFQRAIGYEHEDVHILTVSDGAGSGSHIEQIPITKYYPPDSIAAFFWLKNRRSKEWRDKQEIEHSGIISIAEKLREARERSKQRSS